MNKFEHFLCYFTCGHSFIECMTLADINGKEFTAMFDPKAFSNASWLRNQVKEMRANDA